MAPAGQQPAGQPQWGVGYGYHHSSQVAEALIRQLPLGGETKFDKKYTNQYSIIALAVYITSMYPMAGRDVSSDKVNL